MVTYLGTFSNTEEIKAGVRVTSRTSYVAKSPLGKIVSIPVIKESTQFILLEEKGFGDLVEMYSHSGLYIAPRLIGAISKDDGLGFSTFGIGYVPPNVEATNKETRRWPRNWYGDNIKS